MHRAHLDVRIPVKTLQVLAKLFEGNPNRHTAAEISNASLLAELTNQQRAEIRQQLRSGPKQLSEITVTGLDMHNNPWHRELRAREVRRLADAGEARLITAEPPIDHHGKQRDQRPAVLGWQLVEETK